MKTYTSLKIRILITGMFVLALVTNLSCKKFLDEKPDDKVTTPTRPADLQALLDNGDKMNTKWLCYDDASADDYFMTPENYARLNLRGQSAYIWKQYQDEHINEWSKAADVVYISNVCLETVEKLLDTGTPEQEISNVKGSALVYRAAAWLKWLFIHSQAYDDASAKNDLGIVLRKTADFNVPSVRSSVDEGYAQVIGDLQLALTLLPDRPVHVMRPSKAAAYALLARTYLSMRKYDAALVNAEHSLAIKNDLIDYNTINTSLYSPFQSYNIETVFHLDISAFTYGNLQTTYGLVDTVLYQSYSSNDLRKAAYFGASGKYYYFKGPYVTRGASGNNLFEGVATDEVYLMKAECLARLGRIDEAMTTLNTLMKKRWKSTVAYPAFSAATKEDALKIVLVERRKELLFRGLRWMDIKRLNKEGYQIALKRIISGTTYSLEPNSPRFALPIPIEIVDLAGIPQNPGW